MADNNLVVEIFDRSGSLAHTIDTGDYFGKVDGVTIKLLKSTQEYWLWLHEQIKLAIRVGGINAVAYLGDKQFSKGLITQMRDAWLCPEPDVSFGHSPTGEKIWNGGARPLFIAPNERVNVWHLEAVTGRSKTIKDECEDWNGFQKFYVEHMNQLFFRDAQMVATVGQKIKVRNSEKQSEWLSYLKPIMATAKAAKRLNVSKPYPFSRSFKADEVVVHSLDIYWGKFTKGLGLPEHLLPKLADGLSLIDAEFYRQILEGNEDVPLYMGAAWGAAIEKYGREDKIPARVKSELELVARRAREEKINRASKMPMGNFRFLSDQMVKCNYLVVQGMQKKYGCHVLTSNENVKKELTGSADELTWVGVEPQKSHPKGSRTSIQWIVNNPGIFPEEDLAAWMVQAMMHTTRRIALEIESTVAEDMEEAEVDILASLCRETTSVLFRFRQQMEQLVLSGMTLNFAPHLLLSTNESMCKRIMNRDQMKISIPIPCSMGMQVLSYTMAKLAGAPVPRLLNNEIWIHPDKVYAVVADEEYANFSDPEKAGRFADSTGGSDLDDHYTLILRVDKATRKLTILVLRHPNGKGEWLSYEPADERTVKLFPKNVVLGMTPSHEGARFNFTEKVKDVPVVDLTLQPKNIHDAIKDGSIKDVHESLKEIFAMKKVYPNGYTREAALADVLEATEGFSPGLLINTIAACVMAKMPQLHRIPMEDIIDLMQQGGSIEAKRKLMAWRERLMQWLLAHMMATGNTIDRTWAEETHFFFEPRNAKEKEYLDAGKHLGEHTITRLFDLFDNKLRNLQGLWKKWLLHWQQYMPGWAYAHSNWEVVSKRLKLGCESAHVFQVRGMDAFRPVQQILSNLGKLGKDAPYEEKEATRQAYADAAIKYAQEYSLLGLMARANAFFRNYSRDPKPVTELDPLIADDILWNGKLGDLLVAYFRGEVDDFGNPLEEGGREKAYKRRPLLVDTLSFRLAVSDVEEICRWLNLIRSQGRDIAPLLEMLKSHGEGQDGLLKAMDALMPYLPDTGELRQFAAPVMAHLGIKNIPLTSQERLAWRKHMVADRQEMALEIYRKMTQDGGGDGGQDDPTPPAPQDPQLETQANKVVQIQEEKKVQHVPVTEAEMLDLSDVVRTLYEDGPFDDYEANQMIEQIIDLYLKVVNGDPRRVQEVSKYLLGIVYGFPQSEAEYYEKKVAYHLYPNEEGVEDWEEKALLLLRADQEKHVQEQKEEWAKEEARIQAEDDEPAVDEITQEDLERRLGHAEEFLEELIGTVQMEAENGCESNQELWEEMKAGKADVQFFVGLIYDEVFWKEVIKEGLEELIKEPLCRLIQERLAQLAQWFRQEEEEEEVALPTPPTQEEELPPPTIAEMGWADQAVLALVEAERVEERQEEEETPIQKNEVVKMTPAEAGSLLSVWHGGKCSEVIQVAGGLVLLHASGERVLHIRDRSAMVAEYKRTNANPVEVHGITHIVE